jgi:hypothetical protein
MQTTRTAAARGAVSARSVSWPNNQSKKQLAEIDGIQALAELGTVGLTNPLYSSAIFCTPVACEYEKFFEKHA